MKRKWLALVAVVLPLMAVATCLVCIADLADSGNLAGLFQPVWAAAPEAEPTILEVDPSSAPNDLDTPIVITGTDFTSVPTVTLGHTLLEGVDWVSSATLMAEVPWGMDPGVYTMTVTNPDGTTGTAPNAFTVTQGIGVWNQGELDGGAIDEIAINPLTPTTLYARYHKVGLFRSYDGGENWTFQFASTQVENLAVDPTLPTHIYISAFPHEPWDFLYRSDDEGETWIPLIAAYPETYTSGYECWGRMGIHPHPNTPGTVYLHSCENNEDSGGGSGLIVSTNWGEDWDPAIDGLTDTQVTAVAFHPDNPEIMYLGTAGGRVFHSLDGGDSWAYDSQPLEYVAALAVDPFGAHDVWVSSHDVFGAPCALLKSDGADLTAWTEMEPADRNCFNEIEFSPVEQGTVYVNFGQPYKSTDGGDTWEPFIWVPFSPDSPSVFDIALHPTNSNIVYFGDAELGVQKSTDGGMTWEVANHGLRALLPYQLQVHADQPDTVYAWMEWAGVYKGTRGGQAWQHLPISDTNFILIDPVTPTQVYATLQRDCTPYVYTSDDGGQTWETSAPMTPPAQYADHCSFGTAMVAIPDQPGVLVVGIHHHHAIQSENYGSIYRSTDHGEYWNRIYPTGEQEIRPVLILAHDALTPTIIYAGTEGSGMLRSINAGEEWQPMAESIPALDSVRTIAVEPVSPYRVFVLSWQTGEMFVSEDQGVSWSPPNPAPDPASAFQILSTRTQPSVLYAASSQGLCRSSDNGQSWHQAAGVLGRIPVYSLATATADERVILYAGTAGGYVEDGIIGTLNEVNAEGTLVNAGVYRYTTLSRWRSYLPLVVRQQ